MSGLLGADTVRGGRGGGSLGLVGSARAVWSAVAVRGNEAVAAAEAGEGPESLSLAKHVQTNRAGNLGCKHEMRPSFRMSTWYNLTLEMPATSYWSPVSAMTAPSLTRVMDTR